MNRCDDAIYVVELLVPVSMEVVASSGEEAAKHAMKECSFVVQEHDSTNGTNIGAGSGFPELVHITQVESAEGLRT